MLAFGKVARFSVNEDVASQFLLSAGDWESLTDTTELDDASKEQPEIVSVVGQESARAQARASRAR